MSSQAIATSARDLHDFQEPTWSDHSNPRNNDSKDEAEQIDSDQEGQAWVEMDAQQRNQAVGNLLAALAPLSPTLNAKTPNVKTEQEEPHTNGGEDRMEVTDDEPVQSASNDPYSTLPQADTNHNMSLPPLPPLPTDDFMTDEAPAPFSSAIVSDIPEASQATLVGDAPMTMDYPVSQPPLASQDVQNERREIEAFAKIEFEDGNYYITTYACELGRDAFAYKAALARAEEAAQAERDRAQSSSGRRSGLSEGIPRPGDSQVQGSVVSEAGGFGGVDDAPVLQDGERVGGNPLGSNSSERSGGSIVKPQEVLINPPLIPFDYHKMAERQAQFEPGDDPEQDTELPAPVTADHIPDADNCPLIPIHAMRTAEKSEVENHKSISRRHVKIEWDFKEDYFQMKVLGRNGAFLDDEYLNRGSVRRLRDGSKIQISDVWMTFRLPSQNAEPPSEESEREDLELSPPPQESLSPFSNDEEQSLSPSRSGKTRTKVTLTFTQKPSPTMPDGPDGQPMPPKKRGPGRPPKDGIMSTRERKEREKAQKLAEAKAANGGKTPPPGLLRGKFPKPPVIKEEEPVLVETKPEKRKYKKRKREDGEVLQSIEGNEVDVPSEPENAPPQKKARQSKSPSPEYPPVESLTEEQLARPSEPYARLIYDILIDIHPDALPLKQIYRALKLKFPFFVHRVDSEGWQSSVRHNLNQEYEKLFDKAKKEGKGFFWKAIPGALQPQAERRRAAQQAAAAKPKPPPAPRQNPQQGPPPPLNWQNSTPYPQQNGMPPRGPPPPFFVQGPNGPMPPPPNGVPWPPPGASASPGPNGRPPQVPPGQKGQPFYPPPQGGQLPFPAQQAPGAGQQTPGKPGVPQPPSAGPLPGPPPPPPPITSSASRNMPCTTDGLLAIRRFETAMYEQVGNSSKIEEWQQVFASVKRRLLHGAPHSLLPDGENREELTIMAHVRNFIDRFKNPNFVGFSNTGSPAPSNAANTANGPSTATASTANTVLQPVSQPTPAGAPLAPADVPPKVEGLEPGNETAKTAEQPNQPFTLADDKMEVDTEPAVQNIASA
ncbi:hypothetical protein LTR10_020943 [Elasticomyces elasticus]|uniref:Fork-head domain-containing protein n=1 Tax=Exophiala sideris TaxID=1016849 RepID=A0ABR0JBL2_9EURO|nr:hypothetical protein LTR10_020943 [Elasticomyces elasticus]KAK5031098.1 hypothetical protein LTS07_004833 [Exophiala sideris]KAK5038820.1 hypothetical protein LTR13_003851 [Exophiala sideris]KAK5060703.1 hypothetical protein LTR69_005302 [Exophiala sideris]KAK5183616.1 hypothetical protein LTR44_003898 [Eurotiomycetes sp. CCFEE 6388]